MLLQKNPELLRAATAKTDKTPLSAQAARLCRRTKRTHGFAHFACNFV